MPLSLVSLSYVEPHEAHVVQGRRELQRCRVERDRQHSVRACACWRVLAKEIADQLSPFVGDDPIARPRAPCHPFIDEDHDDLVFGIQIDRGWSAIGLPRPVAHRNTRTIAHRTDRKRPIEAGRQLPRLVRCPMKQHLNAKRRNHQSLRNSNFAPRSRPYHGSAVANRPQKISIARLNHAVVWSLSLESTIATKQPKIEMFFAAY